jgi:hypothetical protein
VLLLLQKFLQKLLLQKLLLRLLHLYRLNLKQFLMLLKQMHKII